MYLQPFFPEPVTVPGNVTQHRYGVRVEFVRRVAFGQALCVALAGVSMSFGAVLDARLAGSALLGSMVALSFLRVVGKRTPTLVVLDVVVLLAVLLLWGQVLAGAEPWLAAGLAMGTVLVVLYTAVAGRDFSYYGLYFLGLLAAGVLCLLEDLLGFASLPGAGLTFAVAATWLGYLCYDLSMIVRRRRPAEVVPAIVDVFRDPLNLFSYAWRTWRHWRRLKFV
ncbi:MAG: hypothetical protein KIT11_04620 [Fimbriimonadaceae bacterium]|nr:hypothetical protein [Fimbriimonadaceae bacterium]QYK56822.1 MAG: hypothetical protein KF733_04905 [Fimbriimonadaceae bacterium]